MKKITYYLILLFIIPTVSAKEIDLPLCPTNIQYFPQNLPLHCKMPPNAKVVKFAGPPGEPPSMALSPQGLPMIPAPFPGPVPGQFPGSVAVPGPFPGPMPMPVPASPSAKVPVIVMPFYSPDPAFKKPKPIRPGSISTGSDTDRRIDMDTRSDTDIDTDTDTSSSSETSGSSDTSSERGIWRKNKKKWKKGWKRGHKKGFKRNTRRFNRQLKAKRRRHQKKDRLTPILQYVTKDGYVIYEKKISKGEATDWLNGQNVADENINENDGVAPKQVQVRTSTKHNDGNAETRDVKTSKNNKKKHTKIVQLNDDNNFDYESKKRVGTKNIKGPGNDNNKNKQDRDDDSSEEGSDEKLKSNGEKIGNAEMSTKRAVGKPQRRRSKFNKT
ncbi:hypothetical protein K1T71_006415 [Dendrolimus kikuchii]|uniref:Uncharacterized protein n=1 Tax=Dendrolimus kikuchii TaxID=765133 RepID=A0ACC1D123_9NEOP|nr:hypothetical protein K1T71_006415 [Dendrolimus kikuchii]